MTEQGDSTIVTGSPVSSSGGPRPGEVLGERYEVQERLHEDAFTLDYQALDQETEAPVLVRVVQPSLLPSAGDARAAARRLSRVLGAGGKYLSPLLDADCEGPLLFVVEAMPTGTTLREVIQARLGRGETVDAREMLPVVARLDAALAAVPPPWRHGDVRAERIHIDPDSLRLMCPFLLGALPHDAIAEAIARDAHLRRLYAPEVAKGGAGDAADRFGAACVVFEAMTGRVPAPGAPSANDLGEAGEVLRRLLSADPAARPSSLAPLVEALAAASDLRVPDLDAGAYRQPRRLAIRRKSEQAMPAVNDAEQLDDHDTEPGPPPRRKRLPRDTIEMSTSTRLTLEMPAPVIAGTGTLPGSPEDTRRVVAAQTEPPAPRRPAGASPDGTQELSIDQVIEARHIAGAAPEGTQEIDASSILEERPLRGAKKDDSEVDLDPRLVRAALGVEVEAVEEATPPRAPRPRDPTLELGPDDLELVEQAARKLPSLREPQPVRPAPRAQPTPRAEAPRPKRSRPVRDPSPVELPADIKPIPRPRVDSTPPGPRARRASVLFDDSRQPSEAAVEPEPAPPPSSYSPPRRDDRVTWMVEPTPRAAQPARWGVWILGLAVLLGLMIIAAGAFIAYQRRDTEREQRLQERFQRLQQQEQVD